jgi:hypothetical protein
VFQELDTVVLRHDMDEYSLKQGDVGAVVHCYKDEAAFEVEFVATDGKTIALLTLRQTDIRPVSGREVLHVRELAETATSQLGS